MGIGLDLQAASLEKFAFNACSVLGAKCSYDEASKWITQNYGVLITESGFYSARKKFQKMVDADGVPAAEPDFRLEELESLKKLVRIYGVERLVRAIQLFS